MGGKLLWGIAGSLVHHDAITEFRWRADGEATGDDYLRKVVLLTTPAMASYGGWEEGVC